jgi:hypothetical protein
MEAKDLSILNRFKKALSIGKVSGIWYLSLMIMNYLFLMLLVMLCPAKKMKKEKSFDYEKYKLILTKK